MVLDDQPHGHQARRVNHADRDTFSLLLTSMDAAPVFDTHEHLRPITELGSPMTLVRLFANTYVARSARNADGSPNGIVRGTPWDPSGPDRWDVVEHIIERVRWSGFYRCLLLGLTELYELPDGQITADNLEQLSTAIGQAYASPRWLATVLDRARIETVIWDPFWKPGLWSAPDKRFLPSLRIDSSLVAFDSQGNDYIGCNIIRDWSAHFDIEVRSLADLEELIDRLLKENRVVGSRSLKAAIAYDRSLAVASVSRRDAELMVGTRWDQASPEARQRFGDYIIRFYLDRAREYGLVFQVHTGLARLGGSNPLLLSGLLEDFPTVVFDLFHGGYPWIHESGALAQNYPNVRLNLTWLPQLSPSLAVAALKEWIQVAPQVDCISWGADSWTVEEMYGALLMTKRVVARAIADLVADSFFSLEEGLDAAHSILYRSGAMTYAQPAGAKVETTDVSP